MTMAAAFRCKQSLLICADTLISTGTLSQMQSKIMGYRMHDGAAIFTYSGNVNYAEAAIQECEEALLSRKGNGRRKSEIAKVIKDTLKKEWNEHIAANRFDNSHYDYQILIAIQSDVDGLELLLGSGSQVKKVRGPYECIGVGRDIAIAAIRRVYWNADLHGAVKVAAYALANAKRGLRESVGGNSVLVELRSDGVVKGVPLADTLPIELTYERFERECGYVFLETFDFIGEGTDSRQDAALEQASRRIGDIRESFVAEKKRLINSGMPVEASEIEEQMNTPDFWLKWNSIRQARLVPQSTKHDPQPQQPSQE